MEPARDDVTRFAENILPHLKATLFITGAFVVAWSWDLVTYGASHALHNENPLRDQLSFGDQLGPQFLVILLLQYLIVCGAAAVASYHLTKQNYVWSKAAVTAVEFFPSPFFAGKLMGYLGQFSLNPLAQALLNLAATWFVAFLAHFMPQDLGDRLDPSLHRIGPIVRETLGFGLGIAWNVLLMNTIAPDPEERWSTRHLVALAGYLLIVMLIAFRLAADVAVIDASAEPTLVDRQKQLLSFAFYVVCAFTLVGCLNATTHAGWLGDIESLVILLFLSAILSALVSKVDLTRLSERRALRRQENTGTSAFTWILLFLPCVWCCCPWVPILWLLVENTENVHVKENWYKLIAMVSGLASSIEASSMLTALTDALASSFCNVKHCRLPWMFVLLQVGVAAVTTVVLIPAIAPLTPPDDGSEEQPQPTGERRSLLQRVFRRNSNSATTTLTA